MRRGSDRAIVETWGYGLLLHATESRNRCLVEGFRNEQQNIDLMVIFSQTLEAAFQCAARRLNYLFSPHLAE